MQFGPYPIDDEHFFVIGVLRRWRIGQFSLVSLAEPGFSHKVHAAQSPGATVAGQSLPSHKHLLNSTLKSWSQPVDLHDHRPSAARSVQKLIREENQSLRSLAVIVTDDATQYRSTTDNALI